MSALKSDLPTFSGLGAATRAYVAAVVFLGAACVVAAAANLRFDHPVPVDFLSDEEFVFGRHQTAQTRIADIDREERRIPDESEQWRSPNWPD